jgi:hypothetical protein
MWKTEYLSIVESGLFALKAENYEEAYTKLLEGAKLGPISDNKCDIHGKV